MKFNWPQGILRCWYLINQILPSRHKVFAGINIVSIFDGLVMEQCILAELNVCFWLMMSPLIPRWSSSLVSHLSTINTAWLLHPAPNLHVSSHQRPMNYGTKPYDNTETKSFPNNQTGPQDITTPTAHDSIISRKRCSKSVITQLWQTDCLLNASDSWAVRSPLGVAASHFAVKCRAAADGGRADEPHSNSVRVSCRS